MAERICVIDGCHKPARRPMCRMHTARMERHGDPHALRTHRRSQPLDFLLDRVDVDEHGCWLWRQSLNGNGYALGKDEQHKTTQMHRWAYLRLVGPIPERLTLDHLCRVRRCVNPWHLEAVTVRENTLRGLSAAGLNAAKTHCKHGHPFAGRNVMLVRTRFGTGRQCRECQTNRKRKYRARAVA